MVLRFHPLRFNPTNEVISAAGGLPVQDHIRRQGRTLHWLLERCGNRYQVMTNQPWASEAQVRELFEKIGKMMETNRRPREIQYRMYTRLRRDVSMKEVERRWQEGQGEVEMTVMRDVPDGRPRQRQQMSSGWQYMPRGRYRNFSFSFCPQLQ